MVHLAGHGITRPLRVMVGGLGKLSDEMTGDVCDGAVLLEEWNHIATFPQVWSSTSCYTVVNQIGTRASDDTARA